MAAAPRLTQLSGAPQERRSVLLSAAGSAGLPPTPLSRPSHLALWMSEHLRALLEPEQQDQDLDEQVPEGELAKRLNQTLSGHSRASRHFWQLLASRRMVAFVCGASNTFAIAGSTAPDKLSQIRPLFRSILVGQANGKFDWLGSGNWPTGEQSLILVRSAWHLAGASTLALVLATKLITLSGNPNNVRLDTFFPRRLRRKTNKQTNLMID